MTECRTIARLNNINIAFHYETRALTGVTLRLGFFLMRTQSAAEDIAPLLPRGRYIQQLFSCPTMVSTGSTKRLAESSMWINSRFTVSSYFSVMTGLKYIPHRQLNDGPLLHNPSALPKTTVKSNLLVEHQVFPLFMQHLYYHGALHKCIFLVEFLVFDG